MGNKTGPVTRKSVKIPKQVTSDGTDLNENGTILDFNTKHERIVHKLKNLKQRALAYGDQDSAGDIEWILKSMVDNDMYEPMKETKNENIDKDELNVYMTYTNHLMYENIIKQQNYVSKANQMKKSAGYQKFINKFKKNLGGIIEKVNERPTRDLKEIPEEIKERVMLELEKIDTMEFNIFEIDNLLEKKTLFYVLNFILNKYNFIADHLVEQNYINFINEIITGYDRSIPYHHDLHATDVLQTSYILLSKGNLAEKIALNDMDIMATFFAAACHDFKHNGYNNTYHINIMSDIAINYNDISVLENFHVSETFKIILKEDHNPFKRLSSEQFRTIRRRMIGCILSTDMANHASQLNSMKIKLQTLDIKKGQGLEKMITNDVARDNEHQQMILSEIVHTADLSNPAKLEDIFTKWTQLVYQEFFNQGDMERSLGRSISMLCDRTTTNINRSQIGFIKFVVMPQFELICNIIPEADPYFINIQSNLKYFEDLLERENLRSTKSKKN